MYHYKSELRTSLAVQWLGLGALTAWPRVQSLVGEDPASRVEWPKKSELNEKLSSYH